MVDRTYFRLKAMLALIFLSMVAGQAIRGDSGKEMQLTSAPAVAQKVPVTIVYGTAICEGLTRNTDPKSVYASRAICGR